MRKGGSLKPGFWAADNSVLSQLSNLSAIPATGWRMHEGNIPHGEDVDLDDGSWKMAGTASGAPEGAVWFRKWIEIPKSLNGYDLTNACIYLNFSVSVDRGNGAESQGYLTSTKIVYFDGRRVALGEDLEPIILVDKATT